MTSTIIEYYMSTHLMSEKWEIFRMIFNPHWIGNFMIHVQMEIVDHKTEELLQMVSNFGRLYQYYYSLASQKYSSIEEEVAALKLLSTVENQFVHAQVISVNTERFKGYSGKIPSLLLVLPFAYILDFCKGRIQEIKLVAVEIVSESGRHLRTRYKISNNDTYHPKQSEKSKFHVLADGIENKIEEFMESSSNVINQNVEYKRLSFTPNDFVFDIEYYEL